MEDLTHLLVLNEADEQAKPPYNTPSPVPAGYDSQSLLARSGDR